MIADLATDEIELLDIDAWRASLLERIAAGMRSVALYGRADGEHVLVTSVLQDRERLVVARTRVLPAHGYHELSSEVPALSCFERELHEQHGVRIAGHGWQKPIRYEGRDQAAMMSHPFYRIEGKEVHEVAVGPIHAGVIEPGSFRFSCFGEHVLHLEVQLGYQHRGVEARLLEREPRSLAPWVETIAGDTSVGHAWAYSAAIEALAHLDPDPARDEVRACMLELERIAMHLAGLSGLATDIGFLPAASTYGRLRTTAINTTMRLCGSRFGRGAVRPGGSGVRLDGDVVRLVRDNIELIRTDIALANECFAGARSVRHRLVGTGVLSTETARQLGVVGMVARSSGIELDARTDGAYGRDPIERVVLPNGDCWARAELRIREIDASLAWLEARIADATKWRDDRPIVAALRPNRLAIALVEGWRGEIVHALETDATGKLVHYKVQDPSLRNWIGLAVAVRGNAISDFPICNKSFDLSYCGNDL